MPPSVHSQLVSVAIDVARLCVWLALLSAVFVTIERLFALRPAKVLRAAFWTDLGYYFLTSLLPSVALTLPLALLAWTVHRVVPGAVTTAASSLPVGLRLAAVFIVGEIGFYWGHRLSHEIPFLWRFHAIHHSAEHVDWLVNTRAHPLDLVFSRLCGLAPLYVLGLAGPASTGGTALPAIAIIVGTAWGFFIHANVRWRFGWLEWVVATPAFHHWHHTNDTVNRDKNYASMLPVMDRLFGTFHLPARQWPDSYGVDDPVGDTLAAQLAGPIVGAKRRELQRLLHPTSAG